MDFESLNPAIPRFQGCGRMHKFLPMVCASAADAESQLEHFEFLAEDQHDPRREFIGSLCAVLGKRGRIIVYNSGFESQRLGELADWFLNTRSASRTFGNASGPMAVREEARISSSVPRLVLDQVSSAGIGVRHDIRRTGVAHGVRRSRLGATNPR